ncbi:hypothetical protein H6P81_015111 [Aristolochia fimbriata]|uniref:Uncharacterized protein n=1 Tax=Aristolochia fimbriata TaxID=158543 RepID=A0AAV7E7F7_ARIFI|nr:hypothetical protein H6P81_015111 [Aristolochia fimbriata]
MRCGKCNEAHFGARWGATGGHCWNSGKRFVVPLDARVSNSCDMDTSNPAALVNAELLKMHVGRRVRALVQVLRKEGANFVGLSTDGHQLTIRDSPPLPLSNFVEVIGIAEGNQSIRAEICTNFGEKADSLVYNRLCQLANGEFKSLFL